MFQQNTGSFNFAPGQDLSAPGLFGTTPFGNQFGNQVAGNMLGGMDKLMGITNIGANIAALNPAFLPLAIASNAMKYSTGQFMQGAQQQIAVDNMLNKTFKNRDMGGNYGMGVSREGAQQFTNAMRNLSNLPEMMTNDRELLGTFQKLNDMKFLQSTKNMKEMTTKFEKAVKTMRQMSIDLNKTMEDMAPIMQQAMQSGFFSFEDIRKNAALNKYTQGVGIGFSEGRIEGLQQFGSSTFHAMGGKRKLGAESIRNMAGRLSVGLQKGIISEQELNEYTGKMGEDAVADLSQQLLSANARILQQSEQGKLITAFLGEQDKEGKFTGKVDKERLTQLGKIGLKDISAIADEKLKKGGGEGSLSFTNEMQRGLGANISSQLGIDGLQNIIESVAKDANMSLEAKRKMISDMGNIDMRLTDILLKTSSGLSEMGSEYDKQLKTNEARSRLASSIEYNTIGSKYERLKTRINRAVGKPLQEAGGDMVTAIGDKADRFTTAFSRGHFGKATNEVIQAILPFYESGSTAKQETDIQSDLQKQMGFGSFTNTDLLKGSGDVYKSFVDMRGQTQDAGSLNLAGLDSSTEDIAFSDYRGSIEEQRNRKLDRIKQLMTGSAQDIATEAKKINKDKMDILLKGFKNAVSSSDGSIQDVIQNFIPIARKQGIDVGLFLRYVSEDPSFLKDSSGITQQNAKDALKHIKDQINSGVKGQLDVERLGEIQDEISDLGVNIEEEIGNLYGGETIRDVFKKGGTTTLSLKENIAKVVSLIATDKDFRESIQQVRNKQQMLSLFKDKGVYLTLDELNDGMFQDFKDLANETNASLAIAGDAANQIVEKIREIRASNANSARFDISDLDKEKINPSLLGFVEQYNAADANTKKSLLESNLPMLETADISSIAGSKLASSIEQARKSSKDIEDVALDTKLNNDEKELEILKRAGISGDEAKELSKTKTLEEIKKSAKVGLFAKSSLEESVLAQDQQKLTDMSQGYNKELAEHMATVNKYSAEFADSVASALEAQRTFNDDISEKVARR